MTPTAPTTNWPPDSWPTRSAAGSYARGGAPEHDGYEPAARTDACGRGAGLPAHRCPSGSSGRDGAWLGEGLQRRGPHHVPFTEDVGTAIKVGARHDRPSVWEVADRCLRHDGAELYRTDNAVWLTDHVPVAYLEFLPQMPGCQVSRIATGAVGPGAADVPARTGEASGVEVVDIRAGGDWPIWVLSNLTPNAFSFSGLAAASMEGFLQSLKYEDPDEAAVVRRLAGRKAKRAGKKRRDAWQRSGTLWIEGRTIDRFGSRYQHLLDGAYAALFAQSEGARRALLATRDAALFHTIGDVDPALTVLTADELCDRLTRIRTDLRRVDDAKH